MIRGLTAGCYAVLRRDALQQLQSPFQRCELVFEPDFQPGDAVWLWLAHQHWLGFGAFGEWWELWRRCCAEGVGVGRCFGRWCDRCVVVKRFLYCVNVFWKTSSSKHFDNLCRLAVWSGFLYFAFGSHGVAGPALNYSSMIYLRKGNTASSPHRKSRRYGHRGC
jgi:hypothetical protein